MKIFINSLNLLQKALIQKIILQYLYTAIATKLRIDAVDAITSAATHKSQERLDHFHSVVTFI